MDIVFGNLLAPNQGGDQLVSKAVSTAISALFKRTQQLDVSVRAEPVAKLLQGSVDGFDFVGKGLLMYSGLRVEVMELYLQAVAIDFGAIFRGQVKLKQPTQARMRIVLSEEDLTESFNTDFLVKKMEQVQHQGEPLRFQETKITLGDNQTINLQSAIQVGKAAEPVNVDLTARLEVADRRKIQFADPQIKGEPEAIAVGETLVNHLNNLLDLDQFALDGLQLRIDQLRIKRQKLLFYGIAQINHFPKR